nr:MAG TPA: hypothetical protein [Caudoviricetes sp.]DAR40123.1 MAG TPA: hypothetical protein [Caudoviricetes sp.]
MRYDNCAVGKPTWIENIVGLFWKRTLAFAEAFFIL